MGRIGRRHDWPVMRLELEDVLLARSPELRRVVHRCRRLARDVKIGVVYEQLVGRGEGVTEARRLLAKRFSCSVSTVKRALKRRPPSTTAPPWPGDA